MSEPNLVRDWKDPEFSGDRSDHPAGEIALPHGGSSAAEEVNTEYLKTLGCCNGLTRDTCKCDPELEGYLGI